MRWLPVSQVPRPTRLELLVHRYVHTDMDVEEFELRVAGLIAMGKEDDRVPISVSLDAVRYLDRMRVG